MTDNFVSSRYRVEGIRDSNDVTAALQELYDVSADLGLGQAMIEMTGNRTADLVVKHKESVSPDVAAIAAALQRAGHFLLV